MRVAARKRNPFINSPRGGRTLSAMQLPLFLIFPPRGFGVITTTGRVSGKRRRRCIRAIRSGDKVYVVAMKGASTTGWAKNALANPEVRLRIRGGSFTGRARELEGPAEREVAEKVYCQTVNPFDYPECAMWRHGCPSRSKIEMLHREWFERGTPLVIGLSGDSTAG